MCYILQIISIIILSIDYAAPVMIKLLLCSPSRPDKCTTLQVPTDPPTKPTDLGYEHVPIDC